MISNKFLLNAAAGLALTASAFVAPARADVLYSFTGTCTGGCSGAGTAQLVVTDSYVEGTALNPSDFVSFDYFGVNPFTISMPSALNATLPPGGGFALVNISDGSNEFLSDLAGNWGTLFGGEPVDDGVSGVWSLVEAPSAVPEPGSFVMLAAAGVAALAAKRRKA
jgi:hypothetical protein